jgi:hypothetical protein
MLRLHAAALACLTLASGAHAAGTTADTDINNRATITYDLAGTAQALIESSPTGNSTSGATNGTDTTFEVDQLIDFTVTEANGLYTEVLPNSTFQAVAFTLQHDGNAVQDFSFTAEEMAGGLLPFGGGTDSFNGSAVEIVVESGATVGYQDSEDNATFVDDMAVDTSVTVYVVRDIGAEADAAVSGVALIAQVAVGGVAGQGADITTDDVGVADDPAAVDIVFADAVGTATGDVANDGKHSDTDGFIVRTVSLVITKTSTVIDDPVNGTSFPKAIPGATIEYAVTVLNSAGSGTATDVTVTDDLDTHIAAGDVAYDVDGFAAAEGMEVTAPNINGGAAISLTNVAADDEGTFAANVVTVNGIDLAPGETATVKYRVVITP